MLFEEVLDPDLANDQKRCYSRVAALRRSFARKKADRPEKNELKSRFVLYFSNSSFFHQSSYLWSVTDCAQDLDSDEEDGREVGHCYNQIFVSIKDGLEYWDAYFQGADIHH